MRTAPVHFRDLLWLAAVLTGFAAPMSVHGTSDPGDAIGVGPIGSQDPLSLTAPDPAPYHIIVDRADWLGADGRRLAFCCLGYRGEERGRTIAIYEMRGGEWTRTFLDLDRGFHPWAIAAAELDGDPLPEIAVAVHKASRYDPELRNRLFVFDTTPRGALMARWLGSSLGFPFDGFAFSRGDADTLLTVELPPGVPTSRASVAPNTLPPVRNSRGAVLRGYTWNGFGFTHEFRRTWYGSERKGNPAFSDRKGWSR